MDMQEFLNQFTFIKSKYDDGSGFWDNYEGKPAHAVFIVAMAAMAAAIFLFKERLTPDQNAPYREQMSGWVETRAVVTANETLRAPRNRSRVRLTVEFRDGAGEMRSASVYDNALGSVPKGDTITVWYDPVNPLKTESDRLYKEVMGN